MIRELLEQIQDNDWYIPYKVQFWWNEHDIFHPLRIYGKIRNIIRWIPVLWNDFEGDFTPLLRIIITKIRFMDAHMREHQIIADWEKVANEMKEAADALERVANDEYKAADYAAHNEKFPERKSVKMPDGFWHHPPMSVEERDSFRKISDAAEKNLQDDLKLFTDIFREKVRGWWD